MLLQGVVFRTEPNSLRYNVRLKGLDKDAKYRIEETNEEYYGRALMNGGILLPKTWGDYSSFTLHFIRL